MNPRTTVGVYFTKPNYEDNPFDHPDVFLAYHEFGQKMEELGGQLVLVRSMETFLGGNSFRGGWIYRNRQFQRTEDTIEVGSLYNKGEDFSGDAGTNLVNDPEFHALCDKDRTYRLMPEFFPRSVIVESAEELPDQLQSLPDDLLICKPTNTCGGKGIVTGTRAEILSKPLIYPTVIQELLDLSGGIPGVVDGRHDFRIVLVRGTFSYAMVRTPPPGGVLANRSQGGRLFVIPDESVPDGAMEVAMTIDRRLEMYPTRVYTVDLGLTTKGEWKVLELNSPPGLIPSRGNPIMDRGHRMEAEHLLKAAQQGSSPTTVHASRSQVSGCSHSQST